MELVDRLGGSVGPRGLSRFTELDAAKRTGAVVIGTSKINGADLRTTCDKRPDLTALSRCQAAGSAVDISIMGLIPEHDVLFGEVIVRIIRDRVAAAGGSSVLDLPVIRGVGYVKQLGVHAVGTVNAAGVEDLTVSVDLFVSVSSLNLLQGVGPEIGTQTGDIIGSLDVLGSVKTETVSAGCNELFKIIIDHALYTRVLGLQVGQTGGAVTGKIIGRIVLRNVALKILHLLPRSMEKLVVIDHGLIGLYLIIHMIHRVSIAVGSVLRTNVVDNRVDDDLQTQLVSLCAHRYKFGLSTERVIGALIELEADRLVEHPPTVGIARGHADALGRLLDLIGGRNLDGSEALLGYGLEVRFDISERPVPSLQDGTVVDSIR